MSHAEQHKTPVQAAIDLHTALRDSQPQAGRCHPDAGQAPLRTSVSGRNAGMNSRQKPTKIIVTLGAIALWASLAACQGSTAHADAAKPSAVATTAHPVPTSALDPNGITCASARCAWLLPRR